MDTINAAEQIKNASEAWSLVNLGHKNGSITAVFERVGKGNATYSHRQHTKMETKFILHIE